MWGDGANIGLKWFIINYKSDVVVFMRVLAAHVGLNAADEFHTITRKWTNLLIGLQALSWVFLGHTVPIINNIIIINE